MGSGVLGVPEFRSSAVLGFCLSETAFHLLFSQYGKWILVGPEAL